MSIKQLCNHKVRDFAKALLARKVSGAFEKRPSEDRVGEPDIRSTDTTTTIYYNQYNNNNNNNNLLVFPYIDGIT